MSINLIKNVAVTLRNDQKLSYYSVHSKFFPTANPAKSD